MTDFEIHTFTEISDDQAEVQARRINAWVSKYQEREKIDQARNEFKILKEANADE